MQPAQPCPPQAPFHNLGPCYPSTMLPCPSPTPSSLSLSTGQLHEANFHAHGGRNDLRSCQLRDRRIHPVSVATRGCGHLDAKARHHMVAIDASGRRENNLSTETRQHRMPTTARAHGRRGAQRRRSCRRRCPAFACPPRHRRSRRPNSAGGLARVRATTECDTLKRRTRAMGHGRHRATPSSHPCDAT